MSLAVTYINLTKPVLEKYPRIGEMAVRKGLRAYGKFRGEHLREWHEELNLPINMYSVVMWWDVSSIRTTGSFTSEAENAFQPQPKTAYRYVAWNSVYINGGL